MAGTLMSAFPPKAAVLSAADAGGDGPKAEIMQCKQFLLSRATR
jgi:hypothetical protein